MAKVETYTCDGCKIILPANEGMRVVGGLFVLRGHSDWSCIVGRALTGEQVPVQEELCLKCFARKIPHEQKQKLAALLGPPAPGPRIDLGLSEAELGQLAANNIHYCGKEALGDT